MFFGKGIYDYEGKLATTNSFHSTLPDACITCHMAENPTVRAGPDGQMGTRDDEKALSVGGHSWNMQAEWNGKEVENTGSNGVHNTAFTVQVLQKTYKELTGKDVPRATLR